MAHRRNDERVALLEQHWLFRGCGRGDLRRVATLVTPVDAEAGRVLAREGERGRELGVILEGEAVASVCGEVVDRLGPGAFYGEVALVGRGRHAATVTAQTDVLQLLLTRQEVDALMHLAIPSVTYRFVTKLAEQLRRANERMVARTAARRAATVIRTVPVAQELRSSMYGTSARTNS